MQRPVLQTGKPRPGAAALPLPVPALFAPALSCSAVLCFKAFPFSGDLCWSCGTAFIAQQRLDQGAHLSTGLSSSSSFVISHLLSSSKARGRNPLACNLFIFVNESPSADLQRGIFLYSRTRYKGGDTVILRLRSPCCSDRP